LVFGSSRRIIWDNERNNKEPGEVTEHKFEKIWWFTHGYIVLKLEFCKIHAEKNNPLTPELNPSAQRCLTRFLLGILLLKPSI
jgi:hypothetical protein